MIPQVLILHGTRSLRDAYASAFQRFQPVTEIKCACGLMQDLLLGKIGQYKIAYAPVYGAPMASEAVHVFGVLGTPLVIHTGSCGALSPDIKIGDIVVPEEAFCGEGASLLPARRRVGGIQPSSRRF